MAANRIANTSVGHHEDAHRLEPSTAPRRRTVAVIAVAVAALGSFAAVAGSDTDTGDTIEIAFGSTWS